MTTKASLGRDSASFDTKSAQTATDLVEPADIEQTRFTDFVLRRRRKVDPDAVATIRSVYDDPVLRKHYYPKSTYENLHRFDPEARWTNREEQVRTKNSLGLLWN